MPDQPRQRDSWPSRVLIGTYLVLIVATGYFGWRQFYPEITGPELVYRAFAMLVLSWRSDTTCTTYRSCSTSPGSSPWERRSAPPVRFSPNCCAAGTGSSWPSARSGTSSSLGRGLEVLSAGPEPSAGWPTPRGGRRRPPRRTRHPTGQPGSHRPARPQRHGVERNRAPGTRRGGRRIVRPGSVPGSPPAWRLLRAACDTRPPYCSMDEV